MPNGVPQGAVLSPTLFNIFLSDLPTRIGIGTVQFADDTSFYVTYDNARLARDLINSYLTELQAYFVKWKLLLNPLKTSVIHLLGALRDTKPYFRKQVRSMEIRLNNQQILAQPKIKLLGLTLQTNNKFTEHVKIKLESATRRKFAF